MRFLTDKRWQSGMEDILAECMTTTASSDGAVLLKDDRQKIMPSITIGRKEMKEIFSLLGVGDVDELAARSIAAKEAHDPEIMPGVMSPVIHQDGEVAGVLVLARSGKGEFSTDDKKSAMAAARAAGRYLEILAALTRLQKNYLNTILVLQSTIESKDYYSRGHSSRVAEYCRKAGVALELSEEDMRTLHWAAMLHDIGKVGIVDAILQKKGSLTEEEMAIVKEHPVIGQKIVQDLDTLVEASQIIRSHHERYDGRGYPDGLKKDKIPLLARILAIAETFDTITSHTPYRIGQPVEVAAGELRKERSHQFDPGLVDPFLEAVLLTG